MPLAVSVVHLIHQSSSTSNRVPSWQGLLEAFLLPITAGSSWFLLPVPVHVYTSQLS